MKQTTAFPVIKTARLILRRPLDRDAVGLMKVTQDKKVMQFYGMAPFQNHAEALRGIDWYKNRFKTKEGLRWIITTKQKDTYIGDIGLQDHVVKHARAELGFKLASRHWGRGIMSEALEAALNYGFEVMKLNRIHAVVDPGNDRCLRLLKRAGFRAEGVLRDYEREPKGFVDLVMLSLLRRDQTIGDGSELSRDAKIG